MSYPYHFSKTNTFQFFFYKRDTLYITSWYTEKTCFIIKINPLKNKVAMLYVVSWKNFNLTFFHYKTLMIHYSTLISNQCCPIFSAPNSLTPNPKQYPQPILTVHGAASWKRPKWQHRSIRAMKVPKANGFCIVPPFLFIQFSIQVKRTSNPQRVRSIVRFGWTGGTNEANLRSSIFPHVVAGGKREEVDCIFIRRFTI